MIFSFVDTGAINANLNFIYFTYEFIIIVIAKNHKGSIYTIKLQMLN